MFEGFKFSVTSIYKYAVPFGTPAPSAFVMGINLHKFMVDALGGEYAWAAWIVAVAGVIGMEGVGGMSSILVSRAYVSGRFDIMRMAILAVLGYAAFVIIGISTGDDSRALIATVLLTLLGYFVLALWDGMQTLKDQRAEKIETLQSEIELEKERAKVARANARAAKNTAKVSDEKEKVSETFGADWRKVTAEHRAKIAGMTTKQISETYRVSERTALNWRNNATGKP
jgi:hypothetical protein